MWGGVKNHKRYVYRINGVEDHIHIFISLHPSISLANLVKDLKLGSSSYIKEKGLFPMFNDWQDGYSAFTYSQEAKYNFTRVSG
jgi:putative transposase